MVVRVAQDVIYRDARTLNILSGPISIAPGDGVLVEVSFSQDALNDALQRFSMGANEPTLSTVIQVGVLSNVGGRVLSLGTYRGVLDRSSESVQLAREIYIRQRCLRPAGGADPGDLGGKFRVPITRNPRPSGSTMLLAGLIMRGSDMLQPSKQSVLQRLALESSQVPRIRRLPL